MEFVGNMHGELATVLKEVDHIVQDMNKIIEKVKLILVLLKREKQKQIIGFCHMIFVEE